MFFLSYKINRQAKKLGVSYSFHFMKPSGKQLDQLRTLLENGSIKPVIDKIYPFKEAKDALAYSDTGRAKGKIIVKAR